MPRAWNVGESLLQWNLLGGEKENVSATITATLKAPPHAFALCLARKSIIYIFLKVITKNKNYSARPRACERKHDTADSRFVHA